MQTAKQQLRSVLQLQLMAGQLAAKYAPREKSAKSALAKEIRQFFGLTPKAYRKQLAELAETVENSMCANLWTDINFSHVPSVAASRYKKAFKRHAPAEFGEYVTALTNKDPSVKINAGAIFPYDIIKDRGTAAYDPTIRAHMCAQWDALPNYVGDASILPLVDVSGSMCCPVGGSASVTCVDVALSLGVYLSQKNTGKFKDMFLTFSAQPELLHVTGDVLDRVDQMNRSEWGMNTNIALAFAKILEVAKAGAVPQTEMPTILLILSDMAFDAGAANETAMDNMYAQYAAANYAPPQIVWWNLSDKGNVPVKCNQQGAALVSGFSPSLMKSILGAEATAFTPVGIMQATIGSPRYDWQV